MRDLKGRMNYDERVAWAIKINADSQRFLRTAKRDTIISIVVMVAAIAFFVGSFFL